jgi:hydrogenase maturation protein HypF
MSLIRCRYEARGLVQGVGCRPFVWRLASELGLAGWVLNHAAGVSIEVEGEPAAVAAFAARLVAELPPPGQVTDLAAEDLAPRGETGFYIVASDEQGGASAWVLPDLALCAECQRELSDPRDRRCGYPFLNCTHCGPRFTIVRDVPYDRARTTMAGFALCAECRREYEDPADRRFHAQPTACAVCGPRLVLDDLTGEAALARAVEQLRAGGIVAIKGLGGYHLAVRADDEAAVARLRERKLREAKPLAVMVADLAGAAALGSIGRAEQELLCSPAAPIVLLARSTAARLAPSVAPGQPTVGVMLAYTPLHVRLLAGCAGPLVMTSGNLSDEPIACDDEDARARLSAVADGLLSHNRPIARRCDDSVARVWRGQPLLLRRSRGYAPAPLLLADDGPEVILAAGAHQKNTFCLVRGREAFLSHHLGDLENDLALDAYETAIADFERLFELAPTAIAHDPHPDYLATRYAQRRAAREGLPLVAVQHHHAHIAACLADNQRAGRVLGVAFDGTGWGPDGTVWGGELLVADAARYERVGRLRPFALAGGEAAVRQGWRVALALARQAGVEVVVGDERADAVRALLASGRHCVTTSSAGRLFDGFAALCGVADSSRYEGEAAILLEGCVHDAGDAWEFSLENESTSGLLAIDWRPAVAQAVAQRAAGVAPQRLAGCFHRGLARAVVAACARLSAREGLGTVALSGGCFQNMLLLTLVTDGLQDAGLEVLCHRRVPPNDGGLSLGQAAVARARLRWPRVGESHVSGRADAGQGDRG